MSATGPSSREARKDDRRAALTDLAIVAAAVGIFFILACRVELAEKVADWANGYEHWQFDELPLTLLCLSLGLAWFAFRRARVARQEIAERVRAEARIADLLAHNRELSQSLILTAENERCALARELHDEVGQNCTAIRAEASYLIHAQPDDNASIVGCAQRIAQASERLYTLVQHMLHRLRPAILDSLGLESALQDLCERWEEQSGVACGFFPRDIPADLDDSICITLFRLVQEGLTNVARHAHADQVRIDLGPSADGACFALVIADNGGGITPSQGKNRGFGLIGMRERVAGLQGRIQLVSAPGRGLRIEVELPAGRFAS